MFPIFSSFIAQNFQGRLWLKTIIFYNNYGFNSHTMLLSMMLMTVTAEKLLSMMVTRIRFFLDTLMETNRSIPNLLRGVILITIYTWSIFYAREWTIIVLGTVFLASIHRCLSLVRNTFTHCHHIHINLHKIMLFFFFFFYIYYWE